jgi:type II secretory pathway component PulF
MPQFSYKARSRSGEVVEGALEAADRSAVLSQIERLGLFPVAVADVKGAAAKAARNGAAKPAAQVPFAGLFKSRGRRRKPKLVELGNYAHQLANLLKAGMPLVSALNSMGSLETKGIPGEISKQLKQDVTEGKGLSDAMRKQDGIFSDLFINMVKAGEQSGALVDVLRRMGEHYVRFAELQSKFTSAMIYPAFIFTLGIGIMIFFMTFMLPNFMKIFDGMKVPLPMATQVLVGFGHFMGQYWWVIVLMIVAVFIVFYRYASTAKGKRAIDAFKMRAPVLGKVVKLNLYAQFARTLSTLLKNGVPVLTALKISEEVVPNILLKEALNKAREEVTDGKTLSQPLLRCNLFPQLMVDMVRIGEETGDVPSALANVAETYENELKTAIEVMMSLIQPVIIVVMALFVGLLLYSVLSAMFAITSSIGR